MSEPDDNYTAVLLEEIRGQNKAVLESVGQMQEHVSKIPAMQADLLELKEDVRVIKATVTATNKDVTGLDRRVATLVQS